MSRFDRLVALGFEDGHEMVSLWREIAGQHRLLPPVDLKTFEYPHADLRAGSLVLLDWAVGFSRNDLDRLLATGASVIAHFGSGATISPRVVIDNVPASLLDCCARDAFSPARFRRRVDSILAGSDPYANITLLTPDRVAIPKPKSVFLSTPLAAELLGDVDIAVRASMERLGIHVRNPADEPETGTIHSAVVEGVEKCNLVIANLRQKRARDERGHNANVWFEIGYAWRAGKPVLLFRHANDWLKMPSDVQNFYYHTYSDPIDLALQLFYGFGGHSTPTPD